MSNCWRWCSATAAAWSQGLRFGVSGGVCIVSMSNHSCRAESGWGVPVVNSVPLTQAQRPAFEADGFLVVPRGGPPEQARRLITESDGLAVELLAKPGE